MKHQSVQFINELGNDISIEVSSREIDGFPGMYIEMSSPASLSTQHMTLKEAQALHVQLGLFLDL